MFKINQDQETGKIKSLHLMDVTFSYSYLVSPRPESDFNAGTYGTELIIRDTETVAAIKKYLAQVMEEAKVTTWEGKIPKNLNLPLKAGNEESELEADAFVLKTSSKMQPKLFIRDEDDTRAHEVTEEELDDIYAGMIGEAIVSFKAYSYNGIRGIKAYLNAVCKTGDGQPLAAKTSYEDAFSSATEFDTVPKKATPKKTAKKEEAADEDVDLDSMIATPTRKVSKDTVQKGETVSLTIDDLLKG